MNWRTWLEALLTGALSALAVYWEQAPSIVHVCGMLIWPLVLLESGTAAWMQRAYRRHQEHPTDDQVEVEVFPADDWARAPKRFGLVCALVTAGAAVDVLTGSGHGCVMWVLLWGVYGQIRATHRHLETIAALEHFTIPIFPPEKIEQLNPAEKADSTGDTDA